MNKQELIEKIENLNKLYGERYYVAIDDVLNLVNQLDESEKPIRLKDVIKRIKEFDDGTKFKWTYDILKELGSDFGSKMFHEAYQQGRFDEEIEANYGREKVKIPQFVAGWIKYCKLTGVNLYHALEMGDLYFYNYANQKDYSKLKEFFEVEGNQELFARAWLDGYTIEEKRYMVKVKNVLARQGTLNRSKKSKRFIFSNPEENSLYDTKFTRKELEDAGFGEVFNSPLFEVEEVEI
nr:MAG TPA: Protein of unknown function (DUF1642) [Caudoviricetes sp.]